MSWGYHFAHETHAPSELLDHARIAAGVGIAEATCSDHFHPWLPSQGHAGHSFSWLGAALAAAPALSFGVVAAPGQRQHPALVAQAIATLAEMFPRRAWIALGTGEALNERVTGDEWPDREERGERLLECVAIIRRLLAGEEVSWDGRVRVRKARLYTRPERPPPLLGAALTEEGAAWCARWADGLLVGGNASKDLAPLVRAYREAGGRGPVHAQALLAWAPTTARAEALAAERWPMVALDAATLADLESPEEFERACAGVTARDAARKVCCSHDAPALAARLLDAASSGVDTVYLHPLVDEPVRFLQQVLPEILRHAG